MLNCLSFFMFPPFSLKWVRASARYLAFGRTPGHRRLAKCDAGSSRSGGFSPPRRGFSALGRRIVSAFFCVARTSVQRGLFLPRRTHTRCRGRKPHTAATRASRRRTVPAVEGVQGCKPFKALPPYPLAPAFAIATDRRGDQKQCRDFALRSSVSAPRYQAALQGQRLLLPVWAVSKTCAVHLPSAWSLSAPARCRLEDCQQSRHRSLSTESHTRGEARMQ